MGENHTVIESIINNFNGYLQSMRSLALNQCHYSASVRVIKNNFEDEIGDYKKIFNNDYQLISQQHFNYKQMQQLHQDLIFSKLKLKDKEIIKLLDWDIIEYFGLASTSVGGEWNPLVKNGAVVLKFQADKFKSLVYYYVEIGGFIVIVVLSERR